MFHTCMCLGHTWYKENTVPTKSIWTIFYNHFMISYLILPAHNHCPILSFLISSYSAQLHLISSLPAYLIYLILSCLILSNLISSYIFFSSLFNMYHVNHLIYLSSSNLILSYLTLPHHKSILSYHILSCHILSYLILSY